jgi:hypothetical protein
MAKTARNRKTKITALPAQFQAGFLSQLDGRTDLSKALRANYESVMADIGGPDEVGHIKGSLVERFCFLEAVLQTLEHDLTTGAIGKAEALAKWIQAVNTFVGLARTLGVERKLNARPWLGTSKAVEPEPPIEEVNEGANT